MHIVQLWKPMQQGLPLLQRCRSWVHGAIAVAVEGRLHVSLTTLECRFRIDSLSQLIEAV